MKKQLIYILGCSALLSSCHIYSNYERPTNLPTDSLYREPSTDYAVLAGDTVNFGNMPWQEVFTDPLLQELIQKALDNNTDMRTADLTVQQAEAGLMSSRLAFLPSITFSPHLDDFIISVPSTLLRPGTHISHTPGAHGRMHRECIL